MTGEPRSRQNYRPAGSAARDGWELFIDADSAGWQFSGVRVLALAAGESRSFATGECEFILVPLEGSFDVEVDGQAVSLAGRASVFEGPTDTLYVPRGSEIVVSSVSGGRLCLPNAVARERLDVHYLPAAEVPSHVRGGGNMSRLIRDFGAVDVRAADRLIACEVITPGGNWSSYPAHKHDVQDDNETQLEEIYYYEVAQGPAGPGSAFQRVTPSDDRPGDLLEEVRSGDVVLIPSGWHGPAMASPGFDLYYLNVMAGPGQERAWRITDDPTTSWVRDTWPALGPDPRLT